MPVACSAFRWNGCPATRVTPPPTSHRVTTDCASSARTSTPSWCCIVAGVPDGRCQDHRRRRRVLAGEHVQRAHRPPDKGLYFRVAPPDVPGQPGRSAWSPTTATARPTSLALDDAYGTSLAEVVTATLEQSGVEVVGTKIYDPKATSFDARSTRSSRSTLTPSSSSPSMRGPASCGRWSRPASVHSDKAVYGGIATWATRSARTLRRQVIHKHEGGLGCEPRAFAVLRTDRGCYWHQAAAGFWPACR